MAVRFFDTSAFAKHYRPEVGTATVDAFLAETGSRHIISELGAADGNLCSIAAAEWLTVLNPEVP